MKERERERRRNKGKKYETHNTQFIHGATTKWVCVCVRGGVILNSSISYSVFTNKIIATIKIHSCVASKSVRNIIIEACFVDNFMHLYYYVFELS